MKKLVIFDIDGTLTNTKYIDDFCFVKTFRKLFNIDIEKLDWSTFTTITDTGLTKEVLLQYDKIFSDEVLQKTQDTFHHYLLTSQIENPELFKEVTGSSEFFHYLSQRSDIEVGIATGSWKKSGMIKLKAIGINAEDFPFSNSDRFITREEIVLDTIQQAKDFYQYNFQDITYFGDGIWDYKTCQNLKIPLIGIDYHNTEELAKAGVKNIFQDFNNYKDIMEVL